MNSVSPDAKLCLTDQAALRRRFAFQGTIQQNQRNVSVVLPRRQTEKKPDVAPNVLSLGLSAVPVYRQNRAEPRAFWPILFFYINYLDCVAVEAVSCEPLSTIFPCSGPKNTENCKKNTENRTNMGRTPQRFWILPGSLDFQNTE